MPPSGYSVKSFGLDDAHMSTNRVLLIAAEHDLRLLIVLSGGLTRVKPRETGFTRIIF